MKKIFEEIKKIEIRSEFIDESLEEIFINNEPKKYLRDYFLIYNDVKKSLIQVGALSFVFLMMVAVNNFINKQNDLSNLSKNNINIELKEFTYDDGMKKISEDDNKKENTYFVVLKK